MGHWRGWRPSKKPWDPFKPWEFSMMHPADSVPQELLAVAWADTDIPEEEFNKMKVEADRVIEEAQKSYKGE